MLSNDEAERQAVARGALIDLIGDELLWELYYGGNDYYNMRVKNDAICEWFNQHESHEVVSRLNMEKRDLEDRLNVAESKARQLERQLELALRQLDARWGYILKGDNDE